MDRILSLSQFDEKTVITKTVEVLHKGGLVIFPSDTVYGLLVDATNEQAVEKLIRFKNRAPGKAISVFVADFSELEKEVVVSKEKKSLLSSLIPGPFTVVLPSKHQVSEKLESEKGTLGVRVPQYPLVNALSQSYGKPITATSANLGGKSPHYSIESLLAQLPKAKQELIDLIVDAGKLPRNKPSTVIDLSAQNITILRKGDILFAKENTYHSDSASQTKKLGKYLAETFLTKAKGKPVVFVIEGDLGAGKTILTKGIAEHLDVYNIISPTFVIYYEYDSKKGPYQKLVHADLYTIEDKDEYIDLGFEKLLQEGTVLIFEWGEKLGELFRTFQKKAELIFVEITYTNEKERMISIKELK